MCEIDIAFHIFFPHVQHYITGLKTEIVQIQQVSDQHWLSAKGEQHGTHMDTYLKFRFFIHKKLFKIEIPSKLVSHMQHSVQFQISNSQ